MHSSIHGGDDLGSLLYLLALVASMPFCRGALALTTNPPRDVYIEKCENGNDNAENGGDEIFDCEDPSGWRWDRV